MESHKIDNDDGVTIALDCKTTYQNQNDLNLSTLLRVDAALNSSLLMRYGSRIIEEKNLLVLDLNFFYQLLERIGVIVPSTVTSANNDAANLEMREQILLSLLRLGNDHKLYRLRLRSLPTLGGKECVCFEVLHKNLESPRIEILKRIWQNREHQGVIANLSTSKSSSIQDDKNIHLIGWHRRQKSQTKEAPKHKKGDTCSVNASQEETHVRSESQNLHTTRNPKNSGLFSEPHILPGMTLRERVRARAKHAESIKMKTESCQDSVKKGDGRSLSTTSNNVTNKIMSKMKGKESVSHRIITSNTALLRLADALRSYVHMKECRSSVFGKQILPSQNPSIVNLSFQELIIHLGGAIYGTFGSTQKKASKKEITTCLITLANSVPKWLTVAKHKSEAEPNSDKFLLKLNKNIDYQSCVTQVLGGRVCKRKGSSSNINTNQINSTDSDLKGFKRLQKVAHSNVFSTQNDISSSEGNKNEKRVGEPLGEYQSKKKRKTNGQKIDLPNQNGKNGKSKIYNKRQWRKNPQCQQGNETKTRENPAPKAKPRINENLRFCDADHDGIDGNFILSPTFRDGSNASPRGLKMLFAQLNSGKRI